MGLQPRPYTNDETKSNGSSADSKGYRRVFTRYDKLDVIFLAFITLALIHDTLRNVNRP